jgi:hypothetical protein
MPGCARRGCRTPGWVEWSCSQLLQNTPLHPIADDNALLPVPSKSFKHGSVRALLKGISDANQVVDLAALGGSGGPRLADADVEWPLVRVLSWGTGFVDARSRSPSFG